MTYATPDTINMNDSLIGIFGYLNNVTNNSTPFHFVDFICFAIFFILWTISYKTTNDLKQSLVITSFLSFIMVTILFMVGIVSITTMAITSGVLFLSFLALFFND